MIMTGKIKWLFFATVISIFLFTMVPLRTVRADGTGLSISPQQQIVEQGEEFEVDILISTDNATRGAQFDLTFDSSLIRVNSVSQGDFYSGWTALHGGSTSTFIGAIDNVAGKIEAWGIAIINGTDPGGQTGSGTLATVHMEALSEFTGTSNLTLSNVMVTDCDAGEIDYIQLNHGEVTVTGGRDGGDGGGEEPPPEDGGEEDENYIRVNKPFSVNPEEPGYMLSQGSIVRILNDGITEIAGADNTLIARVKDSDAALVPSTIGMIPATHTFQIPDDSRVRTEDNITRIYRGNDVILTIIDLNPQPPPPSGAPDSWIEWARTLYQVSVNYFAAEWTVPKSPINADEHDLIYIFNGIQPDSAKIIQPVLQWNRWGVYPDSWSCNSYYVVGQVEIRLGTAFEANEGDRIRGEMEWDDDEWNVTIANLTTELSTTIPVWEIDTSLNRLYCVLEGWHIDNDDDICGTVRFTNMDYSPLTTTWRKYYGDFPQLTGLDVEISTFNPTTCTLHTNGGYEPSSPGVGLTILPVDKAGILVSYTAIFCLPVVLTFMLLLLVRHQIMHRRR